MKDPFNCGLYKITNIVNGKYYIGCTVNIERRFAEHRRNLRLNKHANPHLQNAWNQYGEDNFDFQIMFICAPQDFESSERYFVSAYKSNDRSFGYNLTIGGEILFGENNPFYGKKHSLENIEKFKQRIGINNHNYGKPMAEEQKDKISEANMGHIVTEETKEKIREARANQPITQNMLDALAKGRKDFTGITGEAHSSWGCKHSKESIERSSKAKWKTVLQINPITNETISEVSSVKEAAEKMGFKSHGNISSCYSGQRKIAGGFIWKFKN